MDKVISIGSNLSTAKALRLLANQIDSEGECNDFVFVFYSEEDETFNSISLSDTDPFLLLGLLEYQKSVILQRMDYEDEE